MNIKWRRTIVIVSAVLIFISSFIIMLNVVSYFRYNESHFWRLFKVNDPDTVLAGPPDTNINPTKDTPSFRYYSFLGLPFLLSLSFVFFLWDRRPARWIKATIYTVLLVVVFLISAFNYIHYDQLFSVKIQLLLDVSLVFLGSINALFLLKVKPKSESGKVLQCIVLGFLFLFAIAVPALSGTLYMLYKAHILTQKQANAPSSSWIAIFVSIPSTLVAIFNYRRTKVEEPKPLITLDGV